MTYSEKLRHPLWQKKRLEILQRDDFTCTCCSDTENELHVHHKKYIFGKDIWDYENNNFITLCKNCHDQVSITKKTIKEIIDDDFVDLDVLNELLGVIIELRGCNPYLIMIAHKEIIKLFNSEKRKIKKRARKINKNIPF